MRKQYTLTMDIEVHDVPSLYAAARDHATNKDGLSLRLTDELLRPAGEIDPAACLTMLIDPGHLAGCEINETSVEEFREGEAS